MTDMDRNGPELTDAELEAIEKRAEAATPGPWLHEGNGAVGAGHRTKQVAMACGPAAMYDERAATNEIIAANGGFIAHARTDVPRLIAALRARDARVAELEASLEKHIAARQDASVTEMEMLRVYSKWETLAESRRLALADAHAALAACDDRAEAAEKRVANAEEIRDESLGRAERAEAACAQMREAIQLAQTCIRRRGHACVHRVLDDTLATDVGAGWVSPEVHAEVVRERDRAIRERAEIQESRLRLCDEHLECGAQLATVTKERDEARANAERFRQSQYAVEERLAECRAQAAVMREVLERGLSSNVTSLDVDRALASDAGKRLAERVRLSDEVVAAGRVVLAMPDGESVARRMNVMAAVARLRDALAALDAHDAQGKGE